MSLIVQRTNYGYILQLLEMEKKKVLVVIGSLQPAIAGFIIAFTTVWNINGKLKEKLKYILYFLFPSLTPNVFVPQLDIVNVNVASQISLYL